MSETDSDFIIVGKITGPYGIKGWVKIHSYTDPMENILQFKPVYLKQSNQWQPCKIAQGRRHGKGIVAQFEHISDRNQAELMHQIDIAVRREQFPEPEAGEYYWTDLMGCRVVTEQGVDLGVVKDFMETGANDVMVVKGERERLLPFVMDEFIKEIDMDERVIRVDWDPDF